MDLLESARKAIKSKKSDQNWAMEALHPLVGLARKKKEIEEEKKKATEELKTQLSALEKPFNDSLAELKEVDEKLRERMVKELQDTDAVKMDGVGAAVFRKMWTFSVEVIEAVPSEYLQVDAGKVRGEIRAGVREIPGISIHQQKVLSITPAKD